LRADRARKTENCSDADHAFRLWEGLLSGGWTLVDWFDADGRRFVIARRCQTRLAPRGLTAREREVALRAALGESSKATSYQLGISPSRVSTLLRAAMAKLGVRTKAQLVIMVRALRCQIESGSLSPAALDSNG
jgi:DNA-binding CsgD family transcriptional regulator